MSHTMFVSTMDPQKDEVPSNCYIDVDIYASELKKQWPLAKVAKLSGSPSLCWKLQPNADTIGIEGCLYADSFTVAIDRFPIDGVAEFVIWHTSMVPEEYPLYLFDEGVNVVLDLRTGVTLDDVKDALA